MSDPTRDGTSGEGGAPGSGTPGGGSPDPNLPSWARQRAATNAMSEERLAAFIGPRWPTYQKKFAPFHEDPAFVPTWNWSAAFFQSAWFLYRKLYLAAFGFMLIPGYVFRLLTGSDGQLTMTELQKPENEGLMLMQIAVGISAIIAAGGVANWLLFRRARAAVRLAAAQELSDVETLPWLARVGGINRMGVALAVAVFLMSLYAAFKA
jgi:hypothetical protein